MRAMASNSKGMFDTQNSFAVIKQKDMHENKHKIKISGLGAHSLWEHIESFGTAGAKARVDDYSTFERAETRRYKHSTSVDLQGIISKHKSNSSLYVSALI